MKKAEKTRNGNTMTESQYFSKIRSSLRKGFMWWKPMQDVLKANSRAYVGSNKRQKFEYQCNSCKSWFCRKDVEIDHVIPAGSLKSYEDIVPFIKRLTAEENNAYQVLCNKCHNIKTQKEKNDKK